MPAKKKTPSKKVNKKPAVKHAENGARLKTLTKKQNKQVLKQEQRAKELPSAWHVLRQSLMQLWNNKKLFLLILAVYAGLYILFVKGISANFQLGSLKENLKETLGGSLGTLGTGVALYGLLLGTAGSASAESGSTYQSALIVIISLALIWALRQTYQKRADIRMRDSFYNGMYALVPFLLVMLVIVLQLVPALITGSLYSVAQNSGILVGGVEKLLGITVLLLGFVLSAYWISSSLFALYIVTLPETGPMAALRAAKKLVKFRRFAIIRKALFLPLMFIVVSAVILIPLIIFLAPVAEVLFMIFTVGSIAVFHAYFYTLYRKLIRD